jgi:ribonuclease BN (tRNA processing enzyme)
MMLRRTLLKWSLDGEARDPDPGWSSAKIPPRLADGRFDNLGPLELQMRVVLHGVRGSTPAPGGDFVRVGGNTSCVAITLDDQQLPTLLLDAGTGLSSVATALDGAPFIGDILLTHLHWDHVQGLPFFSSGDRPDAEVRLLLPAQEDASPHSPGSAAALLSRAMSPPHFPIGPDGLRGKWSFEAVEQGTFSAGGCKVAAVEVPHKGGRTFGYRIEADGASLVYIPDHHPSTDLEPGRRLAEGADVLCHGAMFTTGEEAVAHAYGHATIQEALQLAQRADVGALVLVHHSPRRTDDEVESLHASVADLGLQVQVGREGAVVLDTAGHG